MSRTVFSFSRDLEFATEPELAKRMGCRRHLWLRAAVTELLDNALDSTEEHNIEPEISVESDGTTLTVADNGPGMAPELVERLCVRSERTSTREAYLAPDRGAQGNALSVLMALPLGFGHDQAVTQITSRGIGHTITLRINRLEQRIDLERTTRPVYAHEGTAVSMLRPPAVGSLAGQGAAEICKLVYQHAILNPHARFLMRVRSFNEWRGTTINADRAELLLAAMQSASRAPKHAVLGAVGKDGFARWARNHGLGEPQLLAYATADGVISHEIPWRWEVGVAHLPNATNRCLLVGMNFSPAIVPERLADEVLDYAGWHFGATQPIALFLHRITPARQTLDYGKTRIGLEPDEINQVATLLAKIGAPWIKHATTLDRGKRPPPLPADPKDKPQTFQDAAFVAMPEAYAAASSDGAYPVLNQQVFYAARPKILAATGKEELGSGERSRFCYVLLPQFMQDHPELTARWRVLYKPRGELIEPHTRRRVGLGTVEVTAYRAGWTNGLDLAETDVEIGDWEPFTSGPHNRFGAVLIVEKGGIADIFRQVDIGRRHDLAVVGNEGQSVEAELRLVDALGPAGVPVFLLTDFDRQGFTIAENLRSGTWRHRYATAPKVVHVGLRLDQINALGGLASERDGELEDEPIGDKARKHVSDDRLRQCGATGAEIDVLRSRRVELNALTSLQLVELVEAALLGHGVEKVIPSKEDLANAWRAAHARGEVRQAIERANRKTRRWAKAAAPADLAERVAAMLQNDPTASWDDAIREIAERERPA